MIETITPFQQKRILVQELLDKSRAASSERIDEELKDLNVANPNFGISKAGVDVYI